MNALVSVLVFGATLAADSEISGTVRDADGDPLPGARVFLEAGLVGPVQETRADANGAFQFSGLAPELYSLFAIAPRQAFGGRSVNLAIDETVSNADLRLSTSGTLSGRVVNFDNVPVAGAQITRVLLMDQNVGIPLTKLASLGFDVPVSDQNGKFSVSDLPRGQKAALKIAHSMYAQEGAAGLVVGGNTPDIILYQGILLTGNVLTDGAREPVANALVEITRTQPVRETATTRSAPDGSFVIRLKPGGYDCFASGEEFLGTSRQPVFISGENPVQQVDVFVAGTATVTGKVLDAASSSPIAGARVYLERMGARLGVSTTGPTGEYRFTASSGPTAVGFESATGYVLPPNEYSEFNLAPGAAFEAPTFWVRPVPEYRITVVDSSEKPVSGAAIRLLRPAVDGWISTDEDGAATLPLETLPADGIVLGTAEHPAAQEAAVFALREADREDAVVQLLPSTRIEGRVVDEKGKLVFGAHVSLLYAPDEAGQAAPLWDGFTANDGVYRWVGAPARVPIVAAAVVPATEGPPIEARSAVLVAERADGVHVPDVVLAGPIAPLPRETPLDWSDSKLMCGSAMQAQAPIIAAYADVNDAAQTAGALVSVSERVECSIALLVGGAIPCDTAGITVYSVTDPLAARFYVLDPNRKVLYRCLSTPSLIHVRELLGGR